MLIVFAVWLLLSVPVALLAGMGIALGSRREEQLVTRYPLSVPTGLRQGDSAVMELSA